MQRAARFHRDPERVASLPLDRELRCTARSEHGDLSFHDNSWDLARRKHFTLFLANKIRKFARPGKHCMIRVDPIHSTGVFRVSGEAA